MRAAFVVSVMFLAGCAAAETLKVEPYVDPSQLDVPWPKHSHVKMPWRGFLETKPAADLLAGIGVCYHHQGGSVEAQLGLLANAGIRCIRWEQPFGSYDPDTKIISKGSQGRYREVLGACKKLGIVPIVLLNAHHGYPCKMRSWDRRVMADAPKGSTELLLDSVEGFRPVYSGTNGLTAYWAGEVLFTEIDKERKAVKLSKPLPKDLKKGDKLSCIDFYYLPFFPVGTPEFEETAGGWVDYARSISQIAKEEGIPIELEVWNELSFGSNYAGGHGINAYWPGHAKYAKDFLNPGGHAWEVTRRTVEMAKKEFPGTRVIWGWSNTTFFHCPIAKLPPGIDVQSYHPYGTGWRDMPAREQDPKNPARCLEGFCPTYRLCMPEGWAHTFIQCETLMHHLRPDKRLTVKPEGSEHFSHYITEHGIVPAEAGVKGEAAALKLKDKFLVRAILFWLNKGLDRITIFQAMCDKTNEDMGIMLAKCRELKAMPPDGEIDPWLSPALLSLRRTVRAFDGTQPIAKPRQFSLDVAKLGEERKVFDMPDGKRPLYFCDLFTALPFQVTDKKFVIAFYVMTPNYNIEDLKDVAYRVTLRPVDGEHAKLGYYDPLADRGVPVKIVEKAGDAVTVELPTIDTPRLLTIEEKE